MSWHAHGCDKACTTLWAFSKRTKRNDRHVSYWASAIFWLVPNTGICLTIQTQSVSPGPFCQTCYYTSKPLMPGVHEKVLLQVCSSMCDLLVDKNHSTYFCWIASPPSPLVPFQKPLLHTFNQAKQKHP